MAPKLQSVGKAKIGIELSLCSHFAERGLRCLCSWHSLRAIMNRKRASVERSCNLRKLQPRLDYSNTGGLSVYNLGYP